MNLSVGQVLVISPHTDDMELGAGGTVRKLVEAGAEIKYVVFSDCKASVDTSKFPDGILRKECKNAANHIGIKDLTILEIPVRRFPEHRQEILEYLYSLRKENNFNLVFTTWEGDLHQDHNTVANETKRAFMKTGTSILSYEVPGNCPDFAPQVFFEISEKEVEIKVEMLQLYKSQVARRGYFEIDAIKSLMGYQGHHIGAPYAEAFQIERGVIRGINSI